MNKRERVIVKYNGICQICGKQTNTSNYKDYPELDHIVPKSHGGSDNEDNLCLVCNDCNNKKSNLYGDLLIQKIYEQINSTLTGFNMQLLLYELKNKNISLEQVEHLFSSIQLTINQTRTDINSFNYKRRC